MRFHWFSTIIFGGSTMIWRSSGVPPSPAGWEDFTPPHDPHLWFGRFVAWALIITVLVVLFRFGTVIFAHRKRRAEGGETTTGSSQPRRRMKLTLGQIFDLLGTMAIFLGVVKYLPEQQSLLRSGRDSIVFPLVWALLFGTAFWVAFSKHATYIRVGLWGSVLLASFLLLCWSSHSHWMVLAMASLLPALCFYVFAVVTRSG
jgi:hypothetical protein